MCWLIEMRGYNPNSPGYMKKVFITNKVTTHVFHYAIRINNLHIFSAFNWSF